jgi:hypothetical protein
VSLSAYALVSLDELKDHVGAGGSAKDSVLEGIINRVTDEIEQHLSRWLVCPVGDTARGALTEYHTMQSDGQAVYSSNLRTLEWPIRSVTTVHEDSAVPRAYGAGVLLVAGTDYEVIKPKGLIRRIGGAGLQMPWNVGHRAIKVVYVPGYATPADVPARIKSIALRYAALIWDEQKRGSFGVSGASDSLGNFTRFAPAQLTDDMKDALASERQAGPWVSGERDA